MNILLFGGTGFIGEYLARKLSSRKDCKITSVGSSNVKEGNYLGAEIVVILTPPGSAVAGRRGPKRGFFPPRDRESRYPPPQSHRVSWLSVNRNASLCTIHPPHDALTHPRSTEPPRADASAGRTRQAAVRWRGRSVRGCGRRSSRRPG